MIANTIQRKIGRCGMTGRPLGARSGCANTAR
jgi:hypothetical protein